MAQAKGQRPLMQGTCKSCGASILWVRTAKGKQMPLDTKPQKLITLDDMPEATGYMTDCYTPHWATCPQAAQHRRRS